MSGERAGQEISHRLPIHFIGKLVGIQWLLYNCTAMWECTILRDDYVNAFLMPWKSVNILTCPNKHYAVYYLFSEKIRRVTSVLVSAYKIFVLGISASYSLAVLETEIRQVYLPKIPEIWNIASPGNMASKTGCIAMA
jgi:hypothetical protein